MGKMELEVKVLNIDEKEFEEKLKNLGATFIEKNDQILYTYDLPTIYGRFIDILTQMNNPESALKYETSISKLKLLFFDIDNLLGDQHKQELVKISGVDNLVSLLTNTDMLTILNKQEFIDFVSKFHNNEKKWIRLRQTKDKITIAVKHILAKNDTNIQQMLETEIEVPSIKETNDLLEALGFSYKSYQEKRRTTYMLDGFEIDIDTWPGIPTYFEIEGNSEEELEVILNKLGYDMKDTVSCTADDIYIMNGKTMFEKREIKFDNFKD
jgi:adenylate cyclase, class 2